jgi:NADH-quinone oxidoreductase subunit H
MVQFVASVATMFVMLGVILGGVAYSVLLERRVASWIQDRVGPNRVGPGGLFQPIADGMKLMIKEDFTPLGVDKVLFTLAPLLVVVTAIMAWAIIPWGGNLQWGTQVIRITAAPINVGVVYVLAIGSMGVYGIILGGFGSNNKYAFLGSMRTTAQMISYEIPMALCVLIVVLMHSTFRADWLVELQANGVWTVCYQPLLALIFFTCSLAECGRMPFDLPETETELVGGYHTEFSSMRFALYFLAEYMHMIAAAGFFVLLFLGGWDLPFVNEPLVGGIVLVLIKVAIFAAKIFLIILTMIVVRWTLPRFRFDQLMALAWQVLIPVTVAMLLASATIVYLGASPWWHLAANVAVFIAIAMIGSMLPQGAALNKRVRLEGSRFYPPSSTP